MVETHKDFTLLRLQIKPLLQAVNRNITILRTYAPIASPIISQYNEPNTSSSPLTATHGHMK